MCVDGVLLTMLPWLHTYDIIQGEAVLRPAHPDTAETFLRSQPKQEIANRS